MAAGRTVALAVALAAAWGAADDARAAGRPRDGRIVAAGLYGPLDGGECVRPGDIVRAGRAGATVSVASTTALRPPS